MPSPHQTEIRVRYSESDQMGIVHHASYLVYLEEARTGLMRHLGIPYDGVEARGIAMAVRKAEVRYRSAARYGDTLRLATWVERCGAASITFATEVRRADGDDLVATGTVEVACCSIPEGLRPIPLPDDIRAVIARHRDGASGQAPGE
jgi:acyl-CoA thioester hydrolase